ncbi:NAD(P)H-binding protein [Marivirga harenae]|uniref:NAD(P)-dependent oxidoreductase n=1 Tax=Marivirga harenae TaxID=2010992 RepID=UPI0026DF6A1E|nr:NAD(P)H-binding protein [Marivirga harenae]WKV12503.1 NAD(P)H-binding protein [Marivirga harenae]|tara:strand:+ start:14758 stop:15402 length:645 start_codon:yes stop_codon:yes gene_type:complete
MKKLAVFGASGKTGAQFVNQALKEGYSIKALARNPGKIQDQSANLEVIKGDVLNAEDVAKTLSGTDMVVSLFGHVKGSPDGLQTQGTKNIIGAMKESGINQIISLSGGGLPFPEKDQPKFPDKMIRFIMKIAVPKILNDAKDHAELLKKSDRDWIIVRGPRLTDDTKKEDYRIGWVGVDASTKIGRADLADFILQLCKEKEFEKYGKQMPFVSY